jgi:hypothetical protein
MSLEVLRCSGKASVCCVVVDDALVVKFSIVQAFYRDEVIGVVADGDELRWVKMNIANLPYPRGKKQVRWEGDMARLIVQAIKGCF